MHRLWDNPIFLRARQVEARRPRQFARRYGAVLLIALGPLLSFLLFSTQTVIANPWGWAHDVLPTILGFSGFLLVLYSTMRGVNGTFAAISLEREQQTYDSLLSTLLTPAEVVEGKLAAGLWPLVRELLLVAPLALGLGALAGLAVKALGFLVLCLACAGVFGMLGMYASYTSPNSPLANRRATSLVAFCLLGGPLLDGLVHTLLMPGSFTPVFTVLSPLAAATSLASEGGMWLGTLVVYILGMGLLSSRLTRLAQAARRG